ncbi:MAG: GNAT family N-acetyltransferase [Chloroflexi bacterium]|nr:GNAT family N-acetyltransferase [Chloroflexota bacterium]
MTDILIRPMRAEEKKDVAAIMRRSFELTQQWFFSWSPDVLVAEQDGKLLGAVVLKMFSLPGGRKGGLIAWVFTAPEARGTGAGQQLIESALKFLEEQGCDELMACVEGYNSSSSKLFATRGFSILSPGEQFRRYGLGALSMWIHTFHFIDVGHFLWVRPAASQPDNPTMQWWGNWLANILVSLLALGRQNGFGQLTLSSVVKIPLLLALFLGIRTLSMQWMARRQKMSVRYRAWESGFPLSVLIALAFGAPYPVLGSLYPTSDRWRYRDLLPKLGTVALSGVLPALALTWGAWALSRFGGLGPEASSWISSAMTMGLVMMLFDVVLVFFPFVSFNGRRIWDWNKLLWGLCALATVALFFV